MSGPSRKTSPWLLLLGPGLLVAATGVGAGDLAGGAFAGSKLGVAILWAVIVGALIKFVLNEGLARWQLATRTTFVEGLSRHLGWFAQGFFLLYLFLWTWFVARALASASGVAAQGLLPLPMGEETARYLWAVAHAVAGVALCWFGSFKLFERLMAVCIGIMFLTVIAAAILSIDDIGAILRGLIWPTIPFHEGRNGHNSGPEWTLALIGGVGCTLTILCYGYWLREQSNPARFTLKASRLDLAIAYSATALFGMAMVILADGLTFQASGARSLLQIADRLGETLHPVAEPIFLLGAWAAICSSLLGVWQAVPYLFADYLGHLRNRQKTVQTLKSERPPQAINRRALPYRGYLLYIGVAAILAQGGSLTWAVKAYGVFGALFMPLLALALLILLNRPQLIGAESRNRLLANLALVGVIIFFSWMGYLTLTRVFS